MFNNEYGIPIIAIEGDYRERGRIYGEICRDLIQDNVASCKYLCTKMRNITIDCLMKEAQKFLQPLQRYDSNILQEMKGIAEGAKVDLNDIILLNSRSELMNNLWNLSPIHEGCTTCCVTTKNERKMYLAQTWDWIHLAKNKILIVVNKSKNDLNFLTITEPGIVGNIGINNKGISVFLNYLSVLESNQYGAPYHVLLRRALESYSIEDLQRNIIRSPIAFAIHILAANQIGEIYSYELTANGIDFTKHFDRYFLHTNHILSQKLSNRRMFDGMYKESYDRYETALKRLDLLMQKEDIDQNDIYGIFSKHDKSVGEICRHFQRKSEFEVTTLFTVIVELDLDGEYKLFLSIGNPCKNKLFEIDLKKILW